MSVDPEFEKLVKLYYQDLYRFGFSLTRSEADACDLTQQTFYIWANKGHQLKDLGKVKGWLFTTLHREFLQMSRRQERFSDEPISEVAENLPHVSADLGTQSLRDERRWSFQKRRRLLAVHERAP